MHKELSYQLRRLLTGLLHATGRDFDTASGRPAGEHIDWRRRGIAGAVLMLLAFGLLDIFAIHPFYAGDETAHTNYALDVSHGRLPLFTDRFPARIVGMSGSPTWTAVHGPLYYSLVGLPLRIGVETVHGVAGVRVARLITLLLSVVAVVLVARLTRALLPGRPHIEVAAAGFLAVITSFQQLSASIYNDALSILLTTGLLILIVKAIREGCSWTRTAALALLSAAAAATRASGLEIAALAVVAAASWAPGRGHRPAFKVVAAAIGRMACVACAVVVTTGWFYARNLRLYGDLDGATKAVAGRPPGPPLFSNAFSGRFWLEQYDQLWGYFAGEDRVAGAIAIAAHLLLAGALVGGGVLLARAGISRARRTRRDGWRLTRNDAAWIVVGVHVLLVVVTVLVYFERGAIPFDRYFFPLLPLVPVIAAVMLAALPTGRHGLPTAAATLTGAAISVAMTPVVLSRMLAAEGSSIADPVEHALTRAGVPNPALAVAMLAGLFLVGLALQTIATVRSANSAQSAPPVAGSNRRPQSTPVSMKLGDSVPESAEAVEWAGTGRVSVPAMTGALYNSDGGESAHPASPP